eukprot:maker-scaffold1013_size70870-snap-gene-0.15 protein:Tk07033 transcript:maker-scaffold1013_size70870-snap-gene-0.15-mRNA-1 annotation:"putative uncharacterized protein"
MRSTRSLADILTDSFDLTSISTLTLLRRGEGKKVVYPAMEKATASWGCSSASDTTATSTSLSERSRARESSLVEPLLSYVHLGYCRVIAGQQQPTDADIRTEIVRLSEVTTVAEALILADEHVDVTDLTKVLPLVGHVGIAMIPPPG